MAAESSGGTPAEAGAGGAGRHRKGPRAMGFERIRLLFGRSVSRSIEALRPLPGLGAWRRRLHASRGTTRYDVPVRGGAGLDGLTLAFVSDVHAGFYMTPGDLSRLAEELRALAPDVLCLGGDLVATRTSELTSFGPLLDALDPPLGTFAILGNHECFYLRRRLDPWVRLFDAHGARTLVNQGARLERGGASLWLGGVDDRSEGTPDVEAALQGRRPDEPAVLLSHHPDVFPEAAPRVDLQLSGHTHGGQVRLFGWAPITHSKHGYRDGLFERDGARMIVARGVGTSFLPVRIGAPPEIVLARLRVAD